MRSASVVPFRQEARSCERQRRAAGATPRPQRTTPANKHSCRDRGARLTTRHAPPNTGKFYLTKHNGRRLTFQTSMGTADIKARFLGKDGASPHTHELNVSTYQMCILML